VTRPHFHKCADCSNKIPCYLSCPAWPQPGSWEVPDALCEQCRYGDDLSDERSLYAQEPLRNMVCTDCERKLCDEEARIFAAQESA